MDNATTFTASIGFAVIAKEAMNELSGATAESRPRGSSSGFGGLGLEGMVGMEEEPREAGAAPPGEGRSGAMSGESSWKGGTSRSDDRAGGDRIAVAAVAGGDGVAGGPSPEGREWEGRAARDTMIADDTSQGGTMLMIKK